MDFSWPGGCIAPCTFREDGGRRKLVSLPTFRSRTLACVRVLTFLCNTSTTSRQDSRPPNSQGPRRTCPPFDGNGFFGIFPVNLFARDNISDVEVSTESRLLLVDNNIRSQKVSTFNIFPTFAKSATWLSYPPHPHHISFPFLNTSLPLSQSMSLSLCLSSRESLKSEMWELSLTSNVCLRTLRLLT